MIFYKNFAIICLMFAMATTGPANAAAAHSQRKTTKLAQYTPSRTTTLSNYLHLGAHIIIVPVGAIVLPTAAGAYGIGKAFWGLLKSKFSSSKPDLDLNFKNRNSLKMGTLSATPLALTLMFRSLLVHHPRLQSTLTTLGVAWLLAGVWFTGLVNEFLPFRTLL